MAIDWGRVAMGVGTGYLSAKIANTEANDKIKRKTKIQPKIYQP